MLQAQLAERQRMVFDFLRQQIKQTGMVPTIRELADGMGFRSPNGVMCHLRALERKGLIHRICHKSRSIILTDEATDELRGMPLAGVVQAGILQEAVEQHERIDINSFWKDKDCFMLRVDGDSMIDAHIAPGDYVVVRPRRTAERGDIVIAKMGDGEATLKYWFPERSRVRLQPANPKYKPIYSRNARVIGVVVGVVRNLY